MANLQQPTCLIASLMWHPQAVVLVCFYKTVFRCPLQNNETLSLPVYFNSLLYLRRVWIGVVAERCNHVDVRGGVRANSGMCSSRCLGRPSVTLQALYSYSIAFVDFSLTLWIKTHTTNSLYCHLAFCSRSFCKFAGVHAIV